MMFNKRILEINPREEADRIDSLLSQAIRQRMRRSGAVVGISGGIDSSAVLALCVRSLGAERVKAVIMPERDSDVQSEVLARDLARHFGIEPVLEKITACLESFGCYQRRDAAIRRIFPEYDAASGYKAKISLPPNLLDEDTLNVFSLTILRP